VIRKAAGKVLQVVPREVPAIKELPLSPAQRALREAARAEGRKEARVEEAREEAAKAEPRSPRRDVS